VIKLISWRIYVVNPPAEQHVWHAPGEDVCHWKKPSCCPARQQLS
jgi:hypothetical protein